MILLGCHICCCKKKIYRLIQLLLNGETTQWRNVFNELKQKFKRHLCWKRLITHLQAVINNWFIKTRVSESSRAQESVQQSLLGGLGYICVPAQRCPFTTHWVLQLPLHLSVVIQEEMPVRGGCIRTAEEKERKGACLSGDHLNEKCNQIKLE